MKSKLLFIALFALLLTATTVSAQSSQQTFQSKEQIIDRYQQQKESIKASFKRDMEALNNQQNLTVSQRQEQKRQIIDTYQERKKSNQEAFKINKKEFKDLAKAEKLENKRKDKMKDNNKDKSKKRNDNPKGKRGQ